MTGNAILSNKPLEDQSLDAEENPHHRLGRADLPGWFSGWRTNDFFWQWNHHYRRLEPANSSKDDESLYAATDDHDEEDEKMQHTTIPKGHRRHQHQHWLRTLTIVASIICMATYVLTTLPTIISLALARRRLTCGTNIEEARALGCTLDQLTFQWLPPQCSRAGYAEFETAHGREFDPWATQPSSPSPASSANGEVKRTGDGEERRGHDPVLVQDPDEHRWRFYKFDNYTDEWEIPMTSAPLHEHVYYTTHQEHLAHCTWIIIRGAEAREAGDRVDGLTGSLAHTRHCALSLYQWASKSPLMDHVNFDDPGVIRLGSC